MKKTIFTICSVLTVCAIIVMSCEKDETKDATKVYYNTQPGYSTGGNPNPNGVATSGGSATTGGTSSSGTATSSTTTGSTCTNAMTVNSVACTSVSASGGMATTYRVIHSGSCIQIQLTFSTTSPPTAGTYQIVSGTPGAGQVEFMDVTNSIAATGGSVTIATGVTGAANGKATYSNVVAGALTCTGTACY